jgi:hypothetical protein
VTDHIVPPDTYDGIQQLWSWCARCQRAYVTGTGRLIRFYPDALHPHPSTLKLCPYDDCTGSTSRDGWRWTTFRLHHPEYPVRPDRHVRYAP